MHGSLSHLQNHRPSFFSKRLATRLLTFTAFPVVLSLAISISASSHETGEASPEKAAKKSAYQFVEPPPATFDVQPAEALERPPIPSPDPNDQLPPPNGTGQAKPSLAGRAAFLLHSSKNNAESTGHTGAPTNVSPKVQGQAARLHEQTGAAEASRLYLASFEDTFMAVITSCAQIGLAIDSMDSNQGIITAHTNSDGSQKGGVVLTVRESAPHKTEVLAVRSDPQNSLSASIIDNLLLQIGSLITNGGTL